MSWRQLAVTARYARLRGGWAKTEPLQPKQGGMHRDAVPRAGAGRAVFQAPAADGRTGWPNPVAAAANEGAALTLPCISALLLFLLLLLLPLHPVLPATEPLAGIGLLAVRRKEQPVSLLCRGQ